MVFLPGRRGRRSRDTAAKREMMGGIYLVGFSKHNVKMYGPQAETSFVKDASLSEEGC